MKRLFALLCLMLPVPASAQNDLQQSAEGVYHCRLQHRFDGILDISQTLTAQGEVRETRASWVQPGALYNRKRAADRDISDPSYMTISVDSRRSPVAGDPTWFDMTNAKVQITVVTRGKMRRATQIVFRRPSRSGERYEDGLSITGDSSRYVPWTTVALPYRVFGAFADGEPLLSWTLLKWVGGDSSWGHVEQGEFDLRKVEAFARAVDAARPAVDAMRTDYRKSCEFEPFAEADINPEGEI